MEWQQIQRRPALPKMKSNIIYLVPFLLLFCTAPAFATVTISNSNFEFQYHNLNVTTPVTVDSFEMAPIGFTTRYTSTDDLHQYQFDRTTTDTIYDVHWDSISSIKAQYTITDVIADARHNVTGVILADVELDDVPTAWSYVGKNIIDVGAALKIEDFFIAAPTTDNAIIISVNKSPFIFRIYNDTSRMTCEMSIQGGVIFNTNDLNLNICNGTSWLLPDGSPT